MKNFVITIGREFASGGKEVGKRVAKELGVDFYDASLLREKAKELGIEEGIFDLFDEKPTKSFLFSVVMDPYAIDSAVNEGKVIEAQRKVIDNAAKQGSCVIVGRRADKILADNENVVSVFIGADIEDRMKRYLENDGTSPKPLAVLSNAKTESVPHTTTILTTAVGARQTTIQCVFLPQKWIRIQL